MYQLFIKYNTYFNNFLFIFCVFPYKQPLLPARFLIFARKTIFIQETEAREFYTI